MKTSRWIAILLITVVASRAGDWPQWRHDASRSGATDEQLPGVMHLQWTRSLPLPQPAWPQSQTKLQFDASYEPIVIGHILLIPSMVRDSLTAYDTRSGKEIWRFYADGPIRFAPAAYKGKLYIPSDDGHLYCVRLVDGRLMGKFLAGTSNRKVLGNGRMIGMWPLRGAPVIDGNTIYLAAGIWPFMGVFIHAINAETGKVEWSNTGSGSEWTVQQHSSPAFAGIAAQGYTAAAGNHILISGGRTIPAVLDASNGKLLNFRVGQRTAGRSPGGHKVIAVKDWYFNGNTMYDMESNVLVPITASVVTADTVLSLHGGVLTASDIHPRRVDKETDSKKDARYTLQTKWRTQLRPALTNIFIKAGSRVYGSGSGGLIAAFDIHEPKSITMSDWQTNVSGTPWSMVAADARLFVVTIEGKLYCFGAEQTKPTMYEDKAAPYEPHAGAAEKARIILTGSKTTKGYCLMLGLGSDGLAAEIARQSDMYVVVIDPNKTRVRTFREQMDRIGLYGKKISAIVAEPFNAGLPQYFASLVVCEDPEKAGFSTGTDMSNILQSIRPYGGRALFKATKTVINILSRQTAEQDIGTFRVFRWNEFSVVERVGQLPGSSPWTHQNADSANTLISKDKLVKAPLGLLWFGGPPNDNILPRHGHGPSPQVSGGRLFIEGRHLLRAVDVYTGLVLWEREFTDLGEYYDNTDHHPGANEIGGNYVAVSDALYVKTPDRCVQLDPASGRTVTEHQLPADKNGKRPKWGSISVWRDLLVATGQPIHIPSTPAKEDTDAKQAQARSIADVEGVDTTADYSSASKSLYVINRITGALLWSRAAKLGFRHNAIAAGGGMIFCLDRISKGKLSWLKRRGFTPEGEPVLYALAAGTGRILWSVPRARGTWLAYSEQHNALLVANAPGRDRPEDEPSAGMAVYRASDGKRLWRDKKMSYIGPCMIRHDSIITQGEAYELLTGRRITREDPITGDTVPWTFSRKYGCNNAIGGEHLLLFRSAAAGYFDLSNNGGTANLGGFKSGCTANLIPADGVLNAPDYTRTCTCSYQNQTSLALVHMPTVAQWTFNSIETTDKGTRAMRLGMNFGAPGDRLDDDGTLWIDVPSAGSPSPTLDIALPDTMTTFRKHPSLARNGSHAWIVASGIEGEGKIKVNLDLRRAVIMKVGDTAPIVDGIVNDTCWADAEPARFADDKHEREPEFSLRLYRTEATLFIGYQRDAAIRDGKPVPFVATARGKDAPTWDDDELEIFITDRTRQVGLVFGTSCSGATFDGRSVIPKKTWADISWNCNWQSVVRKDDKRWSAEIAIPLAVLRQESIDTTMLQLNAAAVNKSGNWRSSLSVLCEPGSGGFGRAQRFVPIVENHWTALPSQRYNLTLYFAEPGPAKEGDRVFDVLVQGKRVLRSYDIIKTAGGVLISVSHSVDVDVVDWLEISLVRSPGSKYAPVICGAKLAAM